MNAEIRENLAAEVHNVWAGWYKYQLKKALEWRVRIIEEVFEMAPLSDFLVSEEIAAVEDRMTALFSNCHHRWTRQVNTPYEKLTEEEKESDREIADRYISIIKEGLGKE